MNTPSTLTVVAFVLLTLVMAATAAFVLWRRVGPIVAAAFLLAYLGVPGALARAGLLTRFEPPPHVLLLVLVLTVGTFAAASSSWGARLARDLPLALLVGYQAFRIPVELILHRLAGEGVIPPVMSYSGANFDIVTGVTALGLGLWLTRNSAPRALVTAWNALGLVLLAIIVGIAVLAMPTPFMVDFQGPPNTLPATYPFIWLPTVLVQLALFGHLLVMRRLRAMGGSTLAPCVGSKTPTNGAARP